MVAVPNWATSGVSGNLHRVGATNDVTQFRVIDVGVAPGDVAADQSGLSGVVGVVGAVQAEVAQGLELSLDAIQPRGVVRGVGQLEVVGLGPSPDLIALVDAQAVKAG